MHVFGWWEDNIISLILKKLFVLDHSKSDPYAPLYPCTPYVYLQASLQLFYSLCKKVRQVSSSGQSHVFFLWQKGQNRPCAPHRPGIQALSENIKNVLFQQRPKTLTELCRETLNSISQSYRGRFTGISSKQVTIKIHSLIPHLHWVSCNFPSWMHQGYQLVIHLCLFLLLEKELSGGINVHYRVDQTF